MFFSSGFEGSLSVWTYSGLASRNNDSHTAHSGNCYFSLGYAGWSYQLTPANSLSVVLRWCDFSFPLRSAACSLCSVPANLASVVQFWYQPRLCTETTSYEAYRDYQLVQLRDAHTQSVLFQFLFGCVQFSAWEFGTIELSPFAGRNVSLLFAVCCCVCRIRACVVLNGCWSSAFSNVTGLVDRSLSRLDAAR